jgi:hypothetical protein
LRLGKLCGGGQQVMLGRSSHGRDQLQDMPGVVGQCGNARQEDRLKPPRKLLTRLVTFGRKQFLGQERVAA